MPATARARTSALAAAALVAVLATPARGDAIDDRRALVVLRVLAYDLHLDRRTGDEVRIVVAYPPGDAGAAERTRWVTAFAAARKLKVAGRAVVVSAYRVDSIEGFERTVGKLHATAVIACDGIARTLGLAQLAAVTRAHQALSFTARESEVVKGLAVGIVPGKTRDEIVVNLDAAAAEGVKFDAGLLQVAHTTEDSP